MSYFRGLLFRWEDFLMTFSQFLRFNWLKGCIHWGWCKASETGCGHYCKIYEAGGIN